MKKFLSIILLLLALQLDSVAQGLNVSAPSHVATGENFRLSYVVNTQDVGDIRLGNIPEAFEVITGPYRSSQASYQVVNGHASSSSSTTFTFILCAVKSGTFKIPEASVEVNGHRVKSRAVQIKVSGKSSSQSSAPHMHDNSDEQVQMRAAGSQIRNSDLFIKVSSSATKVYEQEPVTLTYKVYTLVDLNDLKGNMPDLTGFHTLEVPLPQQKSFHVENINGRPYRCVTWSQYIMYPQVSGQLKIPSIVFKGTVLQQNRDVDPFEAFFNGGSAYVEVKKDIVAPGLTLNVMQLPTKPAGFSGGVGEFNISAQLAKNEFKSNEPLTIRIVVSGKGNLKLIKQPQIVFPKDFDKYDPKITDKTKITNNGLEGNMIYDYTVVPRNQGKYTIPAIEFTYFDTKTHSYKTAKTQPLSITVGKGDKSATSVSDYGSDLKNKDIYGIKEGDATMQNVDDIFFGSFSYWILLSVIILIFIVAMYFLRKYISIGNNVVMSKRRGAYRVALKSLKKANDSMLRGDKGAFYEDVLKALWGYAESKFNISGGELNRNNVSSVFEEQGISSDISSKFIRMIDICEMEHYSPSSSSMTMNSVFEESMNTIMMIENALKGKRQPAKSALMLLFFLMLCIPSMAITKVNADNEYKKGNYQQAVKDYSELLKGGQSAEIYFNLGNAYYRTDNIANAILCYERALLLSPSDSEIQFNLQLAQSKTIDKITPESEMFLVKWWKSAINMMDIDSWAYTSVCSLILALALFAVYMLSHNVRLRKLGFFGALLLMTIMVFSNIFAFQQKKQFTHRTGAIVMSPALQMKKSPDDKAENISVIHEGTRVDIIDDTMHGWAMIRLGDGREGWIKIAQIEKI